MQTDKSSSFGGALFRCTARYIKIRSIMILAGLAIFALFFGVALMIPPSLIEVTDINDYGNYTGTASNSFTKQYIESFFPKQIETSFSDIEYSFKAENVDSYGFEAYLEFTIADKQEFWNYVSSIADDDQWITFAFDHKYQEYSIENVLWLDEEGKTEIDGINSQYPIIRAKIRKILYSAETQTIIFVAIGVYDGGWATTDMFNFFLIGLILILLLMNSKHLPLRNLIHTALDITMAMGLSGPMAELKSKEMRPKLGRKTVAARVGTMYN